MKAIVLTRGRIATVDDGDFDRLSQFKWTAVRNGRTYYAVRCIPRPGGGRQIHILMHHEVFGSKQQLDHKSGDGTDNRKENLRPATTSQNGANRRKNLKTTSRFYGVCWSSLAKKWKVSRRVMGKNIHGGYFTSETEAAIKADELSLKHFGEFAKLNFPI